MGEVQAPAPEFWGWGIYIYMVARKVTEGVAECVAEGVAEGVAEISAEMTAEKTAEMFAWSPHVVRSKSRRARRFETQLR